MYHLLDSCSAAGMLTWHGGVIPEDQIWIKVGGDHDRSRSDGYGVKREQQQLGTATFGYIDNRLILDFRFDLGQRIVIWQGQRLE